MGVIEKAMCLHTPIPAFPLAGEGVQISHFGNGNVPLTTKR